MPDDLKTAHVALDAAVEAAYGADFKGLGCVVANAENQSLRRGANKVALGRKCRLRRGESYEGLVAVRCARRFLHHTRPHLGQIYWPMLNGAHTL